MDRRHIENKRYVVNPRTGRTEMRPARPAPSDPLEGVPFASEAAEREARKAGLTAGHFAALTAGGKTGFTAGQVRELVG